jgi:DNA-binding transcriptional ArsR family regulator
LNKKGKIAMQKPINHLDLIFSALSDKTRRQILSMLLLDDMAVTDIAEPFEMSLAAISKHLIILANAGLIERERHGRINWCKVQPESMREAIIWIESFGHLEMINLNALEEFIGTTIKIV